MKSIYTCKELVPLSIALSMGLGLSRGRAQDCPFPPATAGGDGFDTKSGKNMVISAAFPFEAEIIQTPERNENLGE